VKSWGEKGTKDGEFDTPHSIASDARGNIYVADRGNRRVQVFDSEGAFLRSFSVVGVPVPSDAGPAIGNPPSPEATGTQAPGAPWANLHHAGRKPGHVPVRRVPGPDL
jgi:hypothetical protein